MCLSSFFLSNEYEGQKGFYNFKNLLNKMDEGQIDHALNHLIQTNLDFKKHIASKFNDLENLINDSQSLDFNLVELISIRYSMPEWIVSNWIDSYELNKNELIQMLDCLTRPADIFIRVNTMKASRCDVMELLKSEGISCSEADISPTGIKIHQRTNLKELAIFRDGTIEVQDEGSQLIGYALSPEPGETVLDACAGAGGKTLHIANLMGDQGIILATDMDFIRLRELGKRTSRAGISSVKTQLLKSGKPFEIKNSGNKGLYDSVLVDAPCSGTGTVRRMPMQKYRLNEALLAKHAKKQLDIMSQYSQFVKDGGILVYSTCSLMPQENAELVEKFISLHPEFMADPLLTVFSKHGIKLNGLAEDSNTITLFPHIHGTDGFFMARFVKISV
jgi:16S rRNA (cytosine967-C5)-methyltransferase